VIRYELRPLADAPPIKFRCTLCGFCCRSYTPLVTPEDVRRIQHHLQQPLSSFVVFYRPDDFSVPVDDDERFFITKDGPLAMGLLRQGEACVFLKGNLCSIHSFKPGICRSFPFEPLEPDNGQGPFGMLDGDPCHGNSADDEIVSQDEARAGYEAFIGDYSHYVEQVRAWNAAPGSRERDIEDFLQYAGLDWWRHETLQERR